MTIPYRKWSSDIIHRSVAYNSLNNTFDTVDKWTTDMVMAGLVGAENDGVDPKYWGWKVLIRPDVGFGAEDGADEILDFRMEVKVDLNTDTAGAEADDFLLLWGAQLYPAAPNAWDKDLLNGKYYDGINGWGTYILDSRDGSYYEQPSYTRSTLVTQTDQIRSCAYKQGGGDDISNIAMANLFRNGLIAFLGNYASSPFNNNKEYKLDVLANYIEIAYLNPVVNSISLQRVNPIGGQSVVLTGLGFDTSDAEILTRNPNNQQPTQFGPNGWFAYVNTIQLIGREGQGIIALAKDVDFTVDSDTQITITMPALSTGTYNIRLIKDSANMQSALTSGNTPSCYAGDYTCDENGLMTERDLGLFALMSGTPGVNDPARRDPIFLTKWRFKDGEGNIIFRYYAPIDVYAPDTFYDGRIIGVSGLQRALDDNTGLYLMPDMTVEMSNTDFEFSILMAQYMVKNQIVELFHAWTDEPHAWRSHSFIGIVDDVEFKHPITTFYIKDIFKKYFDKKVPLYRITNEEFPNAHEVALAQSMPEPLGLNYLNEADCKGAVQAHCVHTADKIYLAARGNLHSITQVFSDGVSKSTPADYAVSYDPLGYTLITFTSSQGDNKITFNCTGYMYDDIYDWNSANGYVQNPAYIIAFLFALLAEIPVAYLDMVSIDALAAKFETAGYGESGRLILQDGKDFDVVLAELLFTYGAKGYPTKEGKFKTEKKDITDFLTAMTIWGQLDVEGQVERKYNYKEMINRARAVGDLYPTHDLNLVSQEEERAKSVEDFEAIVEAGTPFEFPWTNSTAFISERLIEELTKRSYGDKRLYFSLPMKFFDDLDINTDFRFQDIWGLSLTGAGEAGRYYYISSLSYNPGGQSIDIVAIDLQYLLQSYFIFGSEVDLPANWTATTYEQRMFGFMARELDCTFPDGQPGKILISEDLL